MPKKPKMQTIKVPDYGDAEINNLACAMQALDQMNAEQRLRALKFFKGRFAGEWPPEDY